MTQAITSRRDGDAFQARMFWINAAKLLDDESGVVRVGFEHGPKGFDDIWIEFDLKHRPQNQFGIPINKEFIQCKWHVTSGEYTHTDLTDPEFINATSVSLLQRAQQAFVGLPRDVEGTCRFRLLTNWRPSPSDPLSSLIRNRSHTLNIDGLFDGSTDRSTTGKIRKCWRDHLSMDDATLRQLAVTLGFTYCTESLDDVRNRLDEACKIYGLKRIPTEESSVAYDDVVRQWAAQRRNVFDRKTFKDACAGENLLSPAKPPPKVFGVKSFEHPIDRLEGRCTDVLSLVHAFDERSIRDDAAWANTLFPALDAFLRTAATSGNRLRIVLDTHSTLAFAAGSILNTKSGRIVEIEQRSPTTKIWAPDDVDIDPSWPSWNLTQHDLDSNSLDIAVAIGVTHNVEPKVRDYFTKEKIAVRSILVAMPSSGPGHNVIASGRHAYRLAEDISILLKQHRESCNSQSIRFHVFVAAPNAFCFYLGRHIQSIRPVTLYEFDFEGMRGGSYQPSLRIPQPAVVSC